MKSLLTCFALLGLGTATVAFADDEPAENACNAGAAEAPADCSALEGDEKTTCEAAAAAAAPVEEKKGGKQMKKSDDGNLEKFSSDEE